MKAAPDSWFDRLARAAVGGMSRRDAVGVLAGTTVTAMLGSWMKPLRAFGRDVQPGKDPGCSGTRTFYRAGCPKPVAKLNYSPKVNGCGPQNGFNPVPQTPLNMATFTPACDEHDRGYGTCNRPKAVTDSRFQNDMKLICVASYPVTGLLSAASLLQCIRNAEIYYTAVSNLGDDPYKEGQEEACDCCDDCAGGAMKCSGECCRPGRWVCGSTGKCCEDCQPGWIKCPYPNHKVCGFGCCMPGSPICCPGMHPGDLRCCNGRCFKGGCG